MAAVKHVYLGTHERVYAGYSAVHLDGSATTLVGTPGGGPVEIRRGGGEHAGLSVPDDGLWGPFEPVEPEPGTTKPTTKSRKAAT